MSAKIQIPVTKSAVNRNYCIQKFLMLGQPGLGKSEFWAQGDKTFFIDTEGNLEHLGVVKLPCRSWEDFRDIYAGLLELKLKGNFPFDTIVIDTIHRLVDRAQEECIARGRVKFEKAIEKGLEINTIGDIPEGQGYMWATDLLQNALDKLQELGCAVVMIGHSHVKKIKDPVKEYEKLTVHEGGQMGILLTSWPNHVLNIEGIYNGKNLERIVWTRPSQSKEAKSHGAVVPDGWRWTNVMAENYRTLRALFN